MSALGQKRTSSSFCGDASTPSGITRLERTKSDRASLPAHLVCDRTKGFRYSLADKAIAHATVSPGEAGDIISRLRNHRCILIRTHWARQHDQSTAVIVIVHEHRSWTMSGGDQASPHESIT